MAEVKLKMGSRVEVVGKGTVGAVAFIGTTQFSAGKWIGVILDEAKGKNNGTVQGKRYFACEDEHGIFVRPTQLKLVGGPDDGSLLTTSTISDSSMTSDNSSSIPTGTSKSPSSGLLQPSTVKSSVDGKKASGSTDLLPTTQTPAGDSSPSGPGSRRPSSNIKPPESGLRPPAAKHTTEGATGSPKQKPTSSPAPTDAASKLSPLGVKTSDSGATKPAIPTQTIVSSPSPATKVTGAVRPSISAGDGSHSPNTELELINLRAEIKTLVEQMENLKIKREEDRQRLHELERLKLQLAQFEENRRLTREQAAEVQRQLAQMKTEKSEVQEAFDRYREEMADIVENMEMATLDKEMAEEKMDMLTGELEALKEQVDELTLENQILKEESENVAPGPDGGPTPQQLKNLEQQNERMKQVLVKLRDLTNQDKQEITRLTKEIGTMEAQVNQLSTEKERMSADLKQSLEQTIDLKEQVDASLGADQMVNQLTQRNLELEEQIEKLIEERNDLDALAEMNDELQENSRDTERELRDEIEDGRGQIAQIARHLDACRETITDYEKTLVKFRDLVTDLQAQNADLHRSMADGKRQKETHQLVHTAAPEVMTSVALGSGFMAQTQTMAKMIEAELRRLESEQSELHSSRLTAFLPDSFTRRGGDNDALLTLLLVDRLGSKANLLASHLTERYPLPACIPNQARLAGMLASPSVERKASEVGATDGEEGKGIDEIRLPGSVDPLPPMTKSKAEFYSLVTSMIHLLRYWSTLMAHYKQLLQRCSVDLYIKLGSLYAEMTSHEQTLDRLLELTRKDQLDENTPLEPLVQSIAYFVQLRTVHLANQPTPNCSSKLSDFVSCLLSAADALATDATTLMLFTGQQLEPLDQAASTAAASLGGPVGLTATDADSDESAAQSPAPPKSGNLVDLLIHIVRLATVMRIYGRRIRRRLPKDVGTQPVSFSAEVSNSLDTTLSLLCETITALHDATHRAGQLTAGQDDSANLEPKVVFKDCLTEACRERLTGGGQPDIRVYTCLIQARDLIKRLSAAMDNGEYDFDGSKASKEPCTLRAVAYKQAQAELEGCRAKLESKDEEVRELQMTLKARASEMSEMSVRVGLAEKRMENAGKGSEEKVTRLEQRLEQVEAQLKRNTRESEQTINALQADLESLEQEKSELREKLKSLSKKALIEGLIKSPIASQAGSRQSPLPGPADAPKVAATPTSVETVRVSAQSVELAHSEITALREAVRLLQAEISRLRGEKMLAQLKSLKPLRRPLRHRRPVNETETDAQEPAQTGNEENETRGTKLQTEPPTRSLFTVNTDLGKLQEQIYTLLAHPKLVRLPAVEGAKPTSGAGDSALAAPELSATGQLLWQTTYATKLKNDLVKLHEEAKESIKLACPKAHIKADFTSFPSNRIRQILNSPSANDRLVSRIIFPGQLASVANDEGVDNAVKLALPSTLVSNIHKHLLSLS